MRHNNQSRKIKLKEKLKIRQLNNEELNRELKSTEVVLYW